MASEIIIAHERPFRPATAVRSTLLQSSLGFLRARGHFDRYLELVDPARKDAILGSLAPAWLPIDLALAHYGACDRLGLSLEERVALGEAVGDRIQGTFMKTLIQGARAVGFTPFTLFARFDALWGRLFQGGSVELTKTGPKDVSVEILGAKVTQFTYFRTAFTGIIRAGFKVAGVRVGYVHDGPWDGRTDRFVIRASWA
jgi:hypothetical protein